MSLDPKKLVEGYVKRSKELDSSLNALSKALEAINAKVEQRNALEAKIESLEDQIQAGKDKISTLKSEFSLAQFEENWTKQEEVQQRRRALVDEVDNLQLDKGQAEQELAELVIDSKEVAKVAAQVDTLSAPLYLNFLVELENALRDKHLEQTQAVQDLNNAVPRQYMAEDDYDDARSQIEDTWPNAEVRKATVSQTEQRM